MKSGKILILIINLLVLISCSGDKPDNKSPRSTATDPHVEAKPVDPAPNPTNSQKSQPDLHISGSQNTHISGAAIGSNHVSGQ